MFKEIQLQVQYILRAEGKVDKGDRFSFAHQKIRSMEFLRFLDAACNPATFSQNKYQERRNQ